MGKRRREDIWEWGRIRGGRTDMGEGKGRVDMGEVAREELWKRGGKKRYRKGEIRGKKRRKLHIVI
jgi:hypothetical protein